MEEWRVQALTTVSQHRALLQSRTSVWQRGDRTVSGKSPARDEQTKPRLSARFSGMTESTLRALDMLCRFPRVTACKL